jgi:hypothetical protein
MNEIDDIKRRAGITENFGEGTDPIQSLVDAFQRSNINGTELMNSIMSISGGSPAGAVVAVLKIMEKLGSSPGATEEFINRIKQSRHYTGGTSGR